MKRHGMAIPVVLIFAAIMGIVSLFLFKSSKQYNRSNETSFEQLQSYFVARAGVEHAMLKIKYLHRELYDAICMSQGRNPLFDFSLIKDINSPGDAIKPYNPGPIFLYKAGLFTPNGVFTPNFNEVEKDKWITTFKSDLKSAPAIIGDKTINAVLDLSTGPKDVGTLLKDFTGQYELTNLNIAAQEVKEEASKVENNVIVELVMDSSIQTPKNGSFDYTIKKTVKISRD